MEDTTFEVIPVRPIYPSCSPRDAHLATPVQYALLPRLRATPRFRNQWRMVPVEQPMYGGRSNLQAHDRGAVGGREDRPRQDPAIVAALRVAADPLMAIATWGRKNDPAERNGP